MSQLLPERRSGRSGSWDPFGELEQLTDRMRRMLDQAFGGDGGDSPQGRGWAPPVDVEESDDGYLVEADLPGVRLEDVEVELVGNELHICGECREREREGTVRKQARRTGRFEYRLTLPDHVSGERVEAKLADGVLTVRVPKAERPERRKIEVRS